MAQSAAPLDCASGAWISRRPQLVAEDPACSCSFNRTASGVWETGALDGVKDGVDDCVDDLLHAQRIKAGRNVSRRRFFIAGDCKSCEGLSGTGPMAKVVVSEQAIPLG